MGPIPAGGAMHGPKRGAGPRPEGPTVPEGDGTEAGAVWSAVMWSASAWSPR